MEARNGNMMHRIHYIHPLSTYVYVAHASLTSSCEGGVCLMTSSWGVMSADLSGPHEPLEERDGDGGVELSGPFGGGEETAELKGGGGREGRGCGIEFEGNLFQGILDIWGDYGNANIWYIWYYRM